MAAPPRTIPTQQKKFSFPSRTYESPRFNDWWHVGDTESFSFTNRILYLPNEETEVLQKDFPKVPNSHSSRTQI